MIEASQAVDRAPRRWLTVTVVNVTHGLSHLGSQGLSVLYPVIRDQLSFGYTGIAFLAVINMVVEGPMQITFGVMTRFLRRSHILGVGTAVAFLGMAVMSLAHSFNHLAVGMATRGLGTSPNHPVGGSVMAYSFPQDRAKALAFHHISGNIGGWIAPLVIAGLLYYLDWRQAVMVISLPLMLMSFSFFFLEEPSPRTEAFGGTKQRTRLGLREYKVLMLDRRTLLLAGVMMVGAAGRGTGALNTYLAVILVDRFGISVSYAALFVAMYTFGGVAGPMVLGWFSDRTSPRLAIRIDLVLSAVFTLLILIPRTAGIGLFGITFFAGFFIYGRGSLLQSLLISVAPEETRVDTQLSMFHTLSAITGPMWILVTGLIVDRYGLAPALGVMAVSYIIGVVILGFVKPDAPHRGTETEQAT